MKTILLDTSIDYTSWDINETGSVEMTEWQPIETAPKDGTNLLVTDGKTTELGWHDEFDAPEDPWCGYIKWPTHWMNLPAPPKKGDE